MILIYIIFQIIRTYFKMTTLQIRSLEKKYPNSEAWEKGKIVRKNLDEIIFIIKINNTMNEIDNFTVMKKLLVAIEKNSKMNKSKSPVNKSYKKLHE